MSRQRTIAACNASVQGQFYDKLPAREPSLADLLDRFSHAHENWTEANDGLSHVIADEIRVYLMAKHGLTKAQTDALGEAL